jgi:hypothetical protein
MRRRLFYVLMMMPALAAMANDSELDALTIADRARVEEEPTTRDWKLYVEGGGFTLRDRWRHTDTDGRRLSMDLKVDKPIGDHGSIVASNRLDVTWRSGDQERQSVNVLKELYLDWRWQTDYRIDVGRVNVFNGVGYGYNPTDFFKGGALRSVITADPAVLKRDRQGAVVLRGQVVGEKHAIELLYSPKLAERADNTPFGQNAGATNDRGRWMLTGSRQLAPGFDPQLLLYKEQDQEPRGGLNVSVLAGQATVLYGELSAGKEAPLLNQAVGGEQHRVFRERFAGGVTYTATAKLLLTAEVQGNGFAMGRDEWRRLWAQDSINYAQYINWLQNAREMPTRRAVLLSGNWRDALIDHLQLSALARVNMDDKSRVAWAEARYQWDSAEMALQWQAFWGAAGTEYGIIPRLRLWALTYRHYL